MTIKKTKKRRKPAPKPTVQALAVAPERQTDLQGMLLVPSVQETVQRLEAVRKFVVKCLNLPLKRAEVKAKKQATTLTDEQRRALEIDYGTIPGSDRPFLKQPGAEKIALWLHVRPVYEKKDLELPINGHVEVVSRCRLFSVATNDELFSGPECSCTTMEDNFRYRFVEADPQPDQQTARRKDFSGEGKWRYVPVLENNRILYRNGVPVMERKFYNRIENTNIYGERNKVRQQAEKRALVKAIRNYGAFSEIFVEDPSEWDLAPQEFSPTKQIVHVDAGTVKRDPDAAPRQAEQAAMGSVVVEHGQVKLQPSPPNAAVGFGKAIQIVWPDPDSGEVAHVYGDTALISRELVRDFHAQLIEGTDTFEMPGGFVDKLAERCREDWGFAFQEISRKRPDSKPGQGIILMTKAATVGAGKRVAYYQVLLKSANHLAWYFCYNEKLYGILSQGKDKQAYLTINAKVIVGIQKIGDREYDEDGITPILQNSEDRRPHHAI